MLSYPYDRLEGELSVATFKQLLERLSQPIHDEDIVQSFLVEVVDIRDTSYDGR